MRILGIDPGTATLGWGVIEYNKPDVTLVDYGAIITKPTQRMPERLVDIFNELQELMQKYQPAECAVEELFFNRNTTTAMSVGQARGVILLAAELAHIDIYEYTPLEVKSALSGYGRAQKGQMQQLVKLMLHMDDIPKPDDAADALAIAIVHTQYSKISTKNMV